MKPVTAPFSQKTSGNSSLPVPLEYPLLSEKGLAILSLLLLADCAFEVPRVEQFDQRKHLVARAVLIYVPNVSCVLALSVHWTYSWWQWIIPPRMTLIHLQQVVFSGHIFPACCTVVASPLGLLLADILAPSGTIFKKKHTVKSPTAVSLLFIVFIVSCWETRAAINQVYMLIHNGSVGLKVIHSCCKYIFPPFLHSTAYCTMGGSCVQNFLCSMIDKKLSRNWKLLRPLLYVAVSWGLLCCRLCTGRSARNLPGLGVTV